ncbi:M20/M25/M40 family metallo-hydrolase [Tautonia sociabilis]|uniref:M20/M25/M40 family metallo-hydrolase n=1 Tax=Tautonia sociabilis TaxID=2080755 RepID=A0A432MKR8_9BACT|nr:M20/M25/M40 family metallo-hydrolase [Tautonia sociabilis]RUL87870.1 M20/M25/M40 family metallo-hydrolase [Tautonia sociabilis]
MQPPRRRRLPTPTSLLPQALCLVLACGPLPAASTAQQAAEPAVQRLRADVSFLADDTQEGRSPGSAGIERSAQYIARVFEDLGLATAPGLDSFEQPFEITGNPRLGKSQDLVARVDREPPAEFDGNLRRDFMPLSIGGSLRAEGLPIAFAGFGITTDEEAAFSYDDYAGLDVAGKAVILLRRAPGYDSPGSPFAADGPQPPDVATFRHKATNAFRHGAKMVLLVNDAGSLNGDEDELLLFTAAGTERYTTIPFVHARRAFVDQILEAAGAPSLAELEQTIGSGAEPTPAGFVLDGVSLDAEINVEQPTIVARNVVGVLEGSGPMAEETVVVGAHYDHLGRGGAGSLAPFSRDIHNGADDNASGTAMLLEMARRLARRPDPLPRRVVFIAFSAEERGLLGSRHYVKNAPLYPLEKTVAMVNFDMVGRLGDDRELTVFGVDSTPGLRDLVAAVGPSYGLTIKPNAQVAGNSDHAPFHEKGIPVAFLFTGTHRDYHRPSDDTERIDFEGMARIADFAEVLLLDFARRPERPAFVASADPEPQPRLAGSSASLGTIPDYDDSIQGVRLNGVREGSAAEKAGLQGGDIIIGFAGQPVGTIYDFMEGLSRSKPGDTVPIEIRRGDDTITLEATLDAAAPREGHDD